MIQHDRTLQPPGLPWIAWLVPALALLCYWPGLGGGFLFDDFPNIVANTRLHVTTLAWANWVAAATSSPAADLPRPLAMLSFAANHYFTGLDPWPMKLTNAIIHALNGVLVVALSSRILALAPGIGAEQRRWLPALVGAAWVLHPINLTAVLLIVQRMEVLSHFFVLLGLLLYLKGRQAQLEGRPGGLLIAGGLIGCTLLGILSKESAVLTPLYALLAEWCLLGFKAADKAVARNLKLVFWGLLALPAILGLAWLAPRVLGDGAFGGRAFTLVERLMTESRVLFSYSRWILAPDLGQLSLSHDDYPISRGFLEPATTLFAVIALPAFLALAIWLRRRRPIASLGLLWFGAAHALTATIIPLELVFEHRNYFASLGLLLTLVDLLLSPTAASRRRLGLLLAVLAVMSYAGLTLMRSLEWSDPVRLSRSEAEKRPESPRATYDWGRTLVILGNYDPGSQFTLDAYAALERARKLPGSSILPNHALIILANRAGAPVQPEWWQDMVHKLRNSPVGPQERSAIASLVECANEGHCRLPPDAMLEVFDAGLARGEDAELLNIFAGYAWRQFRDDELALRLWERAIEINPSEGQYRINRARLLIALGQWGPARADISALRTLGRTGQYRPEATMLQRRLDQAMERTGESAGL